MRLEVYTVDQAKQPVPFRSSAPTPPQPPPTDDGWRDGPYTPRLLATTIPDTSEAELWLDGFEVNPNLFGVASGRPYYDTVAVTGGQEATLTFDPPNIYLET